MGTRAGDAAGAGCLGEAAAAAVAPILRSTMPEPTTGTFGIDV